MDAGAFQFERFTETGKSFTARVTLRQNGQIGFNEGARNAFDLEKFGYAVLFFDAKRSAIGLQFTNNADEPGAIEFRKDAKNTYIPAIQFLERYQIPYKPSQRFELRKAGDFLVVDLTLPLSGSSTEQEADSGSANPESVSG
jgi:hypothetical protein